jgi:hypothetical protein
MAIDSQNNEGARISIGPHSACFESPDVLIFRPIGDVSADEMRQLLAELLKLPRPERGFFYLADASRLGHQSVQIATDLHNLPPNVFRARAVVGAKFQHRVADDLMRRAMFRLYHARPQSEAKHFATEIEARTWFDSLRAQG